MFPLNNQEGIKDGTQAIGEKKELGAQRKLSRGNMSTFQKSQGFS